MEAKAKIKVQVLVNASIDKVWKNWTSPEDIVKWNHASVDWHTTIAENDLRVGGRFLSRMEAKDGSFGFDFSGTYTQVKEQNAIEYMLDDGRLVSIVFSEEGSKTKVSETFEAENENPHEMQRGGWQAILNNFKDFVES